MGDGLADGSLFFFSLSLSLSLPFLPGLLQMPSTPFLPFARALCLRSRPTGLPLRPFPSLISGKGLQPPPSGRGGWRRRVAVLLYP